MPLLTSTAYLNVTPYLQPEKYDSYGAGPILSWLVTGDLLDHGRLPVLTILFFVGVVAAIVARSRAALVVLAIFAVWLIAYFGRPTLGPLIDLFPLHDGLLFHRFIGPVTLGAILLMGLGGAVIWHALQARSGSRAAGRRRRRPRPCSWRRPSWSGRSSTGYNTAWQQRSIDAVDGDADAQAIIARLKTLPPGRVFVGLPATYGNSPGMTFQDLHFYNLLAFNGIEGLARPIESLSLNSDYIWDFKDNDPASFDLFNVRFMVAPSDYAVADFLKPILRTGRYVLYEAPTSGYAQYVGIEGAAGDPGPGGAVRRRTSSGRDGRPNGAPRTYIRYDYPATVSPSGPSVVPGCPDGGRTDFERFEPGQIDLVVECPAAATLIIKTTYHPNWEVSGRRHRAVPTFMVSPSYIGVTLGPGKHQVDAIYRATPIKAPLLALGVVALIVLLLLRGRLDRWGEGLRLPRRRGADPEADDHLVEGLGVGEPGAGDGMREA